MNRFIKIIMKLANRIHLLGPVKFLEVLMTQPEVRCGVCGGTDFTFRHVLWDALINEWQISPAEAEYIDRQQGETCDICGSNLRSIALANALRAVFQTKLLMRDIPSSTTGNNLSILEINEAGSLTKYLKRIGIYTFGAYPAVDLHALPYPDNVFDIVIHSDTLEHVRYPGQALAECRRVLKPDGAFCFTVPIIMGRLSRSREGLPKSYHGKQETKLDNYMVHTEFGADVWTHIMAAGFTEISIHSFKYPAATAIVARNGWAHR